MPLASRAPISAFGVGAVAITSCRPSAPPSAQENANCEVSTRSRILPPWPILTASRPSALAHQTAPSLSAQIPSGTIRSEEHTSELQSPVHLVCRLLLEKKKKKLTSDK